MRNNTSQFEEYGCPEEEMSFGAFTALTDALVPLKAMGSLLSAGS